MRLGEAEWEAWACAVETVKVDLQNTVNDAAVFDGFNDLVRSNWAWIQQNNGGYFCDFVARCYAARVAAGVRRHIKNDRDANSLVRIMAQMKNCAPQLTFEFFLRRFPREPDGVPWQEWTFKQISFDGVSASADLIGQDLEELTRLTTGVEAFVDKQIAHLDRKGLDVRVTFDDLKLAVAKLDDVACKYICLLTGKGYSSLKATVVFDWRKIFTVPFAEPPPLHSAPRDEP